MINVPDRQFGEAVMAYVELNPDAEPTADELIQLCRDRIASYKKPKYVRYIDHLPRTTTGKVLKATLRELAAEDAEVSGNAGE